MSQQNHTFSDELHRTAWPAYLSKAYIRRPLVFVFVALVLCVHYRMGPDARLAPVYVAPVLGTAWYDGFAWGVALGLTIAFARLGMRFFWPEVSWSWGADLLNVGIAMVCVVILCRWAARAGQLSREVRLLKGLLPICMYCHKIRNARDEWERLEQFISEKSEADFTHGICPACQGKPTPRHRDGPYS